MVGFEKNAPFSRSTNITRLASQIYLQPAEVKNQHFSYFAGTLGVELKVLSMRTKPASKFVVSSVFT